MALTEKQKRFVDEYLIDLNATRAYRVTYPNCKKDETAAVNGSKMLRNTKVADYIEKRMKAREKRTEITQDRVLQELALIGFSKATDYAEVVEKQAYAEVNGVSVPIKDADGNPVTYRDVQLTLTEELTEEQKRALGVIKRGRDGVEARPCDKVKALELLGRHLGMWNDKIEHSGTVEGVVIVNDIPKPETG